MAIEYMDGRKHIDVDCLSRALVESDSSSTNDDDDEVIIGALIVLYMAAFRRNDPELRAVIST